LVEIVFKNKLAPDLDDLAEESLSLFKFILLLEEFAHVVVRRTHSVRLRAKLSAL